MLDRTIEEWEEAIRKEGLDTRADDELEEMYPAHERKIAPIQKELSNLLRFPDTKRQEIYESLVMAGEVKAALDDGSELPVAIKLKIDAEFQHDLEYYQWKQERLEDICALINKEQEFRVARRV